MRSREIRDRMSASSATTHSYSSSRRNAKTQAARRFDDKPSIILIKGASISVIALTGASNRPESHDREPPSVVPWNFSILWCRRDPRFES